MKKYESIRIFKNPILESMTHVHPTVPLLLWIPVCTYWTYQALTVQNLSGAEIALWSFIGLLVWTFVEYVIHRFVFHLPTIAASVSIPIIFHCSLFLI